MSESPIQLRDKSGRRVFDGTQSPGGGSSPVEGFSLPIAFDTPGLTTTGLATGIMLAVGDVIMHVATGCTVVWNGDGPPAGYWYIDGQNPYTQSLVGGQLDGTNTDNNGSGTTNPIADNQSALVVALAGQLMFKVVNNADGSEDNSTAGVGLLSALVIHV